MKCLQRRSRGQEVDGDVDETAEPAGRTAPRGQMPVERKSRVCPQSALLAARTTRLSLRDRIEQAAE